MTRIPLQQPLLDPKDWRGEPSARWWAARLPRNASVEPPTLASALDAAPYQGSPP